MSRVSESRHVETFQNEPDMCGSGVRVGVTGAQVQEPESLDIFAGRVAHDIDDVLTVLTRFSTVTAEDISAAKRNGCAHLENASADMETILTAARRGAELAGQLLSFLDAAT